MKRLQIPLIVLLALTSIYLFITCNNKAKKLNQKITLLEDKLAKTTDDYEAKIARLKAGMTEEKESKTVKPQPSAPKPQFQLKTQQTGKGTLMKMKKTLQLTDEQAEGIKTVLNDYQKEKDGIYSGIKHGGEFRFGSFEYLDKLSEASKAVHERIKEIIGESKYRLMLEKKFDLQLGIRIPEKGAKKHETKKSESAQPQSGGIEIK